MNHEELAKQCIEQAVALQENIGTACVSESVSYQRRTCLLLLNSALTSGLFGTSAVAGSDTGRPLPEVLSALDKAEEASRALSTTLESLRDVVKAIAEERLNGAETGV